MAQIEESSLHKCYTPAIELETAQLGDATEIGESDDSTLFIDVPDEIHTNEELSSWLCPQLGPLYTTVRLEMFRRLSVPKCLASFTNISSLTLDGFRLDSFALIPRNVTHLVIGQLSC